MAEICIRKIKKLCFLLAPMHFNTATAFSFSLMYMFTELAIPIQPNNKAIKAARLRNLLTLA